MKSKPLYSYQLWARVMGNSVCIVRRPVAWCSSCLLNQEFALLFDHSQTAVSVVVICFVLYTLWLLPWGANGTGHQLIHTYHSHYESHNFWQDMAVLRPNFTLLSWPHLPFVGALRRMMKSSRPLITFFGSVVFGIMKENLCSIQ
jgi:hypothetical protein